MTDETALHRRRIGEVASEYIYDFNYIQDLFEISTADKNSNRRRWINALQKEVVVNVPPPHPIYANGLYISQLAKTDARGVFAGAFVGCCMHPQGWASNCVWHGHEDPDGAFWVVEEGDAIIAAAWVWRHNYVLVIDSVEMVMDNKTPKKAIQKLFIGAAENVVETSEIRTVYVGTGYNDNWWSEHLFERPFPTPSPYWVKGKRNDDSKFVYILASREGA